MSDAYKVIFVGLLIGVIVMGVLLWADRKRWF